MDSHQDTEKYLFRNWLETLTPSVSLDFYMFGEPRPDSCSDSCNDSCKKNNKPKIGFFPGQDTTFISPTIAQQDFLLSMDHIITTDYHTQQIISKFNTASVLPPCLQQCIKQPFTHYEPYRIVLYLNKTYPSKILSQLWNQLRLITESFKDAFPILILSHESPENLSSLRGFGGLEPHYYHWQTLQDKIFQVEHILSQQPDIFIYPSPEIPSNMGYLFWLSQYYGVAWIAPKLPLYQEMMCWGSLYQDISAVHTSLKTILQSSYSLKQSSQLKAKSVASYVTHPSNIEFSVRHILQQTSTIKLAVVITNNARDKDDNQARNNSFTKVSTMSQQTYCLLQKYSYFTSESDFSDEDFDYIWYTTPYTFIMNQDFLLHKYVQTYLRAFPETTHWEFKNTHIKKVDFTHIHKAFLPNYRQIESCLDHISEPIESWYHPGDFCCDLYSLTQVPRPLAQQKLNCFIERIYSPQFRQASQIWHHYTGKTISFHNQSYLLLPYYGTSPPTNKYQWQVQHGRNLVLYYDNQHHSQEQQNIVKNYQPSPPESLEIQLKAKQYILVLPEPSQIPDNCMTRVYFDNYYQFARRHGVPYQFDSSLESNQDGLTFHPPLHGFFIHKDHYSPIFFQNQVSTRAHPYSTEYYLLTCEHKNKEQLLEYLYYSFQPEN